MKPLESYDEIVAGVLKLVHPAVLPVLVDFKAVIAGGCVRSVVMSEPVIDIDVFAKDCAGLAKALDATEEPRSTFAHYRCEQPDWNLPPIDICPLGHHGAASLGETFPFTVQNAAVFPIDGAWWLVTGTHFFKDNEARRLRWQRGERSVDATSLRKYRAKGYKEPRQ